MEVCAENLGDPRISMKLKAKIHKATIGLPMLNGPKCGKIKEHSPKCECS